MYSNISYFISSIVSYPFRQIHSRFAKVKSTLSADHPKYVFVLQNSIFTYNHFEGKNKRLLSLLIAKYHRHEKPQGQPVVYLDP